MALSSAEDYLKRFDPKEYLCLYYQGKVSSFNARPLRDLHAFYREAFVPAAQGEENVNYTKPRSLRVLDYGAGPAIMYDISAAAVATEIVLAEYVPQNRAALQQWIDEDAEAHDWSLFFKYVTEELEGASHGASEAEQSTKASVAAEKREERLRKIAKVVQCDIWQDPPIQRGFDVEYDVVFSSLCIESASKSREEFVEATSRLCKLLKSGGRIALQAASVEGQENSLQPAVYHVGKEKFVGVSVTEELLREALEKAGCYDVTFKRYPSDQSIPEEVANTAMSFVTATKH